ncbi:hypothetical protein M011DRAFT_399514 [Sporormia fimetaria CBS 119925]|uniref:Uncharacterized protein n=1 Tax=Sporormia fimetaria CBS 119925 TaxID=1340428 RepID=A0A6A6VEZ4_9PLEO|nr:hypothetical protein M011DRAFT_399514 [Sporormia fimetaria CBS 119925]
MTLPPGVPFPTGQFLSPNPSTTNRSHFTGFFLSFPCPENSDPQYKTQFTTHQEMIRLLIDHPAMQPNLSQTFDTPANSKNKVRVLHVGLLRTFQDLVAGVDLVNPESSAEFQTVPRRAALAKQLMLDESG